MVIGGFSCCVTWSSALRTPVTRHPVALVCPGLVARSTPILALRFDRRRCDFMNTALRFRHRTASMPNFVVGCLESKCMAWSLPLCIYGLPYLYRASSHCNVLASKDPPVDCKTLGTRLKIPWPRQLFLALCAIS